ncbi:MAG: hypothetical protein HUU16_03205 [Candidatus Omnitrophica bacterium]|nr:hypothetical protein [bacterium]NUN95159.1 hypothetical protein [Candidatus Omnitrophota bacterium]
MALSFEEAAAWLRQEAAGTARAALREATDGTLILTPDSSGHYAALWTRDFFYCLEGCPEALSLEEAEAGFRYLLAGQRADGAMPDRVQADGLAVYKPGPPENGIGPLPATDNPAFMVKLAHLLGRRRGDFSLYEGCRAQLARALDYPLKSASGLIWVDPGAPHSSYGFFDTILMSGELFFASLLQWEAHERIAEMERSAGREEVAATHLSRAEKLKRALQRFWDPSAGMFRAASMDCNQIDIWGSAFSVYSGLASQAQSERISNYLVTHHKALMQRGQLRHSAPGEYWERSLTPKDRYQNGGHWATPFGWWFVTVYHKDPELAKRTFVELVEDFQRNGIKEWVKGGDSAVPGYVASACQPLVGLARLSLAP